MPQSSQPGDLDLPRRVSKDLQHAQSRASGKRRHVDCVHLSPSKPARGWPEVLLPIVFTGCPGLAGRKRGTRNSEGLQRLWAGCKPTQSAFSRRMDSKPWHMSNEGCLRGGMFRFCRLPQTDREALKIREAAGSGRPQELAEHTSFEIARTLASLQRQIETAHSQHL